jgi:hypothetical protein
VDDLVVVEVVPTEAEAALIISILRGSEIECFDRPTNMAVGAGDGLPLSGPREIVVRGVDADRARAVLQTQRT